MEQNIETMTQTELTDYTHFQTGELTVNKKVNAFVKASVACPYSATKKHVAGAGYIIFLRDKDGTTVAQVGKDSAGIFVNIKHGFKK